MVFGLCFKNGKQMHYVCQQRALIWGQDEGGALWTTGLDRNEVIMKYTVKPEIHVIVRSRKVSHHALKWRCFVCDFMKAKTYNLLILLGSIVCVWSLIQLMFLCDTELHCCPKKILKTHPWVTPLHWLTCAFIMMHMGTVVYLKLIARTPAAVNNH